MNIKAIKIAEPKDDNSPITTPFTVDEPVINMSLLEGNSNAGICAMGDEGDEDDTDEDAP